jgi:hypothetical protein
MSATTNPIVVARKKKVDRDLIHNMAFMQDKVREGFKITQTNLHSPLQTPEKILKFLKEINHIPSLLHLKGNVDNHSVLIIPRNAEGRVGSYDFWFKLRDKDDTWYMNSITRETTWVAPKRKIFRGTQDNKWISERGEIKDYITSIEIFEPNGMPFDRIDSIYGTDFVEIEKSLNQLGIKVIKNTRRLQGSSVLLSNGKDYDAERLVLTAPICFKHTIVRWLKQNQTLDEYYNFVESDDYFSADDKVADIYSTIETNRKAYLDVLEHIPNKPSEKIGDKLVRTSQVLFSTIDTKLRELEQEGRVKVPFEVEVRQTLDNYEKDKKHSAKEMKVLEDRFKSLLERKRELKGENFFELIERYKKVIPQDKLDRIEDLVTNPRNPTWLVKDEGLTSKIKNTVRQEVAKEEGKAIANEPVAQIKPFGFSLAKETLKHGGMVHGKKDKAVPIIAHEGELVVPKQTVKAVLHSSAWKNHIEKIARSRNLTFIQAKQYALGNRTIVKKVKPKKKSYWSDTSESDW